jgi:rod shape determining protein RodA
MNSAPLHPAPSPLRRLNWTLLSGMCLLVALGTAFVYSACSIREIDKLQDLYRLHAGTAAAGLLLYLGLACVNYRAIVRWSWVLYLGALLLLAAVLLCGTVQMGARRWVFGVQPSEIAKLAVILFVAWLLGRRDSPRDATAYAAALGIIAVPVALVLQQPDLGTSLVFVPTVFAMLFAANVAPRAFWITLAVGVAAVVWVVAAVAVAESWEVDRETRVERLQWMTGLQPFQQERIAHFLFPDKDPHGGAWNKRQSEIAVGSGGLWGKGFRKGDQNLLGYLPPRVSCNDFIFSVLAEEAGFVGSLVVLALYALVIGTVLAVAFACPDGVGKLICVGVAVMMFCHVFVNIAMTMGLLPVTGLPLPFISYGRTCLLTMMAALGFVQSVAIHGRESAPCF